MDRPFDVAVPAAPAGQDGQFLEGLRQDGLIAQIFAELLPFVGELGAMGDGAQRADHAATGAADHRIIDGARRNGALAGKVCGAGGGGCVVLLIEPDARSRVEGAIVEAGGEILPVTIDRQGVQVISR